MPEHTLGGIPLGLGMVMKINFFEFTCSYILYWVGGGGGGVIWVLEHPLCASLLVGHRPSSYPGVQPELRRLTECLGMRLAYI